jgi:hypothetical protein
MDEIKMTALLKKLFFCLCLWANYVLANDGVFYATGNHLVPMYETDIAVTKEVLTMQKISNGLVKIVVYYEFFNPKSAKTVEVGFEAASPSGDVNGTPTKGQHPYMSEFTVKMNGQVLPYLVAIVSDSIYYKNGKFIEKNLAEVISHIDNPNEVDFNYVYHFKAYFQQGLNTITHTYLFQLSNSIEINYELPYILTAANRWANRQIDDFTLQVDMGSFSDFYIQNTFFEDINNWKIDGIGKKQMTALNTKQRHPATKNTSHFLIREGILTFKKKNFSPQREFNLFALQNFQSPIFDAKESVDLPFAIGVIEETVDSAKDEISLKILRNLPFARRGYLFKSIDIQQYYDKLTWYIPNPTYQAEFNKLTRIEQDWLKKIKKE